MCAAASAGTGCTRAARWHRGSVPQAPPSGAPPSGAPPSGAPPSAAPAGSVGLRGAGEPEPALGTLVERGEAQPDHLRGSRQQGEVDDVAGMELPDGPAVRLHGELATRGKDGEGEPLAAGQEERPVEGCEQS